MTDSDSSADRTEAVLQSLYSALSQDAYQAADTGFDQAAGLARFTAWLSERAETDSPDQTETQTAGPETGRVESDSPPEAVAAALESVMTETRRGEITLPWLVIRQDGNGNRYRVGRYATRAEAQKIADSLDDRGNKQLYWVQRSGVS